MLSLRFSNCTNNHQQTNHHTKKQSPSANDAKTTSISAKSVLDSQSHISQDSNQTSHKPINANQLSARMSAIKLPVQMIQTGQGDDGALKMKSESADRSVEKNEKDFNLTPATESRADRLRREAREARQAQRRLEQQEEAEKVKQQSIESESEN